MKCEDYYYGCFAMFQWNPVDRWSAEGGRVYTTAMALLCFAFCNP